LISSLNFLTWRKLNRINEYFVVGCSFSVLFPNNQLRELHSEITVKRVVVYKSKILFKWKRILKQHKFESVSLCFDLLDERVFEKTKKKLANSLEVRGKICTDIIDCIAWKSFRNSAHLLARNFLAWFLGFVTERVENSSR
jgi:hypothetical protein